MLFSRYDTDFSGAGPGLAVDFAQSRQADVARGDGASEIGALGVVLRRKRPSGHRVTPVPPVVADVHLVFCNRPIERVLRARQVHDPLDSSLLAQVDCDPVRIRLRVRAVAGVLDRAGIAVDGVRRASIFFDGFLTTGAEDFPAIPVSRSERLDHPFRG